MTGVISLLALLIVTGELLLAKDLSAPNKSEQSDSVNAEPPVLSQNLSGDRSTGATAAEVVARLQQKLAEAKGSAKDVERLCKNGALSKLEMEQRLLKVIQCEAELANARVDEAKEKVFTLQSGVASGQTAKDQLASNKATLKELSEAAEAAMAKRKRAELDDAEANLRRHQQLLKLGIAPKSELDRAEEKVTEVKGLKN